MAAPRPADWPAAVDVSAKAPRTADAATAMVVFRSPRDGAGPSAGSSIASYAWAPMVERLPSTTASCLPVVRPPNAYGSFG